MPATMSSRRFACIRYTARASAEYHQPWVLSTRRPRRPFTPRTKGAHGRPSGDRCGGGRRLLAMAVARGVRRGGGFVCVCTRLLGREAASRSSSTMWGPIPCSHTPNGLQFILLLRVSTYSYFCATGGNLPSTPDDTHGRDAEE